MASRVEYFRRRVQSEGSALAKHSMNQSSLKMALENQRRGEPSKKVIRAENRKRRLGK